MEIACIILQYFGSMTIPVVYFIATLFRGPLIRPMLIGLGLQIFWSIAVRGFVYYSWNRGDSEYYWLWALLAPVNLVALLYFCAVPFYHKQKHPES